MVYTVEIEPSPAKILLASLFNAALLLAATSATWAGPAPAEANKPKLSKEESARIIAQGQQFDGMSYSLFSQGRYKEAIDPLKKSTELYIKALGPNHYYVGDNYAHMGEMYRKSGDIVNAESCYRKAIAVFKSCGGSCQANSALTGLAQILRSTNRQAEAAKLENEAKTAICPKKP